jgi:hypothetical protein
VVVASLSLLRQETDSIRRSERSVCLVLAQVILLFIEVKVFPVLKMQVKTVVPIQEDDMCRY